VTPEQATALIIAVTAGIASVLVSIAQLAIALRTRGALKDVKALVNGHTDALRELAVSAFERGAASEKPLDE